MTLTSASNICRHQDIAETSNLPSEANKVSSQSIGADCSAFAGVIKHADAGKDPKRRKVHSSMYAKLRTNLPREVMAYTDFAFDDLAGFSKDSRRFPSHEEVGKPLHALCFSATGMHKQMSNHIKPDSLRRSKVTRCCM